MKDKIEKGKSIISNNLNLPPEVILDVPKITIIGYKEITVENHKGILCFDKDMIRVNTKIGSLRIEGANFEIEYIGTHTLTISGKFKTIMYEGVYGNE